MGRHLAMTDLVRSCDLSELGRFFKCSDIIVWALGVWLLRASPGDCSPVLPCSFATSSGAIARLGNFSLCCDRPRAPVACCLFADSLLLLPACWVSHLALTIFWRTYYYYIWYGYLQNCKLPQPRRRRRRRRSCDSCAYIYKYLGPDKPSLLSYIQFPQVSNRYLISCENGTGDKNYPYLISSENFFSQFLPKWRR